MTTTNFINGTGLWIYSMAIGTKEKKKKMKKILKCSHLSFPGSVKQQHRSTVTGTRELSMCGTVKEKRHYWKRSLVHLHVQYIIIIHFVVVVWWWVGTHT